MEPIRKLTMMTTRHTNCEYVNRIHDLICNCTSNLNVNWLQKLKIADTNN